MNTLLAAWHRLPGSYLVIVGLLALFLILVIGSLVHAVNTRSDLPRRFP